MPLIKDDRTLSGLGNAVLGVDIISPIFPNDNKSLLNNSSHGFPNWSIVPDANLNIYTGANFNNNSTVFNPITGNSYSTGSNGNGPGTIGMERRRQTRGSVNSAGLPGSENNTVFGTTDLNISASPIMNHSSTEFFVNFLIFFKIY